MIAVYLLAIVLPALVLLYFGVASFQRQHQALDALLQANQRLSGEKLAAQLERQTGEAAQVLLRGDAEISTRKHPIAEYFFAMDRGRVTWPPVHTPPPASVGELLAAEPAGGRQEYAEQFQQAEIAEIRDGKLEAAVYGYRKASTIAVSEKLRALALQRVTRCLKKLGRASEAQQDLEALGSRYGDQTDLSHRPYSLLAALDLDAPAPEKAALWQEAARGHWPLSAEQLEYFAPLLGGGIDSGGAYSDHLRFARDFEEQFRYQGRLEPNTVYSFAFAANGRQYQTFYSLAERGSDDRLVGFAVNLDWVRAQVAAAGGRLVRKGWTEGREAHSTFPSLFPFWELAIAPGAGNPARGGILFQAGITALVLCLLLMGVVLLIRDLSRDANLNRMSADFVGAVSHELKTPITVIRLYGETLLEDDDFSAAQRREFYQIITRESDRLGQLIEKVLAFSKIDRGEKQYHLRVADMAPVVSRTVETYEPYLKRRGYSLEAQLAPALPHVSFDADAISQALVNLLDNAVKYSGESMSIAVRSYSSGGSAVLEVEDYGIGIPREEQEKVFERFYRACNAVPKGGYGLGLYQVRHTMDAHHGKVELESELRRGSRFRLIFPAAEMEPQT